MSWQPVIPDFLDHLAIDEAPRKNRWLLPCWTLALLLDPERDPRPELLAGISDYHLELNLRRGLALLPTPIRERWLATHPDLAAKSDPFEAMNEPGEDNVESQLARMRDDPTGTDRFYHLTRILDLVEGDPPERRAFTLRCATHALATNDPYAWAALFRFRHEEEVVALGTLLGPRLDATMATFGRFGEFPISPEAAALATCLASDAVLHADGGRPPRFPLAAGDAEAMDGEPGADEF